MFPVEHHQRFFMGIYLFVFIAATLRICSHEVNYKKFVSLCIYLFIPAVGSMFPTGILIKGSSGILIHALNSVTFDQ